MLEKPPIQNEKIMVCLQLEFGLQVARVEFLPLGNDQHSAVYRVVAENGTSYFLKLRSGVFDENAAALPKFLNDQGITQIIAPITTKSGQLRANLEPFKLMLYPFIDGQDGYEVALSDRQWQDFGAALKRIHTVNIPFEIIKTMPRETYSDKWREIVKSFLERVEYEVFTEPVAAKLAAFLKTKRQMILELVTYTEKLAQNLQARVLDLVVCHSDLHAGNLLIVEDNFFIVDWDDQILAPKERDLMFVGGGQMSYWRLPLEEETLFYQGYGATELDAVALSYYRFERIVQDIAAYCEQLFLSGEGGEDRELAYQYLTSNFLLGGVLETTKRADKVDSSSL